MIPLLFVFESIGLLVLRLVLGGIVFHGGLPKLRNPRESGSSKPLTLVMGIIECVGGVALILGFFTQWAAALLTLELIIFATWKRRKEGTKPTETTLLIFAALVLLAVSGAGQYSLEEVSNLVFLF